MSTKLIHRFGEYQSKHGLKTWKMPLMFSILVSILSSEAIHVCHLMKSMRFSMSLNTPSNSGRQKHFLLFKNNYCELEALYDRSEAKHFGIKFGFKNNKQCRQTDWIYPMDSEEEPPPFQCSFSLRSGTDQWTHNRIGFVSVWSDHIHYSLFPVDTEDLTPTEEVNRVVFDMKGFIPTVAYNVFSRQDLNTIVFFEQKPIDNTFRLRAQVFNFEENNYYNYTAIALSELEEYTSPDVGLRVDTRPGKQSSGGSQVKPRVWSRYNSQYIPKAVMKTDRSMRIVGLYGIELPPERSYRKPNGTIILFKKDGPDGYQTYWYCVTPEYELSDNCKSPENYELLIDCEKETIPVESTTIESPGEEESDTEESTRRPPYDAGVNPSFNDLLSTTTAPIISSDFLFWCVISFLAAIVVFLAIISMIFTSDPWKDESNVDKKGMTDINHRKRDRH